MHNVGVIVRGVGDAVWSLFVVSLNLICCVTTLGVGSQRVELEQIRSAKEVGGGDVLFHHFHALEASPIDLVRFDGSHRFAMCL